MPKLLVAVGLLGVLCLTAWSYDGTPKKKSGLWIVGTWEGTGYQIDDASTWAMRVTADNRKVSVEYPTLKCGGEWVLVRLEARRAIFTEKLSYGREQCVDNGKVVIERLSNQQLVYLSYNPGAAEVNASAVLNRKRRE